MEKGAVFQELMGTWASENGIPGAVPEDGSIGFVMKRTGKEQELIAVQVEHDEETETVLFFTFIGEISEDRREWVLTGLLRANACAWGTGGAVLGLDGDNQSVILSYRERLSPMDSDRLSEILHNFVDVADYWMETLDTWNRSAAATTAGCDVLEPMSGYLFG